MDEQDSTKTKPPYGSFQTFWTFIDSLASKPLPPQIDRSMFNGKSGTDQAGILMALNAFDLIEGPQQTVQPSLVALAAADKDDRATLLIPVLQAFYAEQFKISDQNGTEKMLLDSFEDTFGVKGDTRRKAATFFLHAARAAKLTLSPNFPATRSGSGSAPGSRAKRAVKKKLTDTSAAQTPPGAPAGGDRFTVQLEAGGSVTLIVDVGHFALSRHKTDREFVQRLMDALTDYEEAVGAGVGEREPEGDDE